MIPQFGHRIIGSIFENHLSYLNQMRLLESAALLRKMCVEFDYPQICRPTPESKQSSGSLNSGDRNVLPVACSHCQSLMSAGRNTCERCRRLRPVCPICQSLAYGCQKGPDQDSIDHPWRWGQNSSMWMSCQACGHAGHVHCLMEWYSQPFSEGTCPTPGCGCDCGPGLTREHRVQQQVKRNEGTRLIRGTSPSQGAGGSTKRDPLKAAHSPAVDKVRVALRNSSTGERTTQSGDERRLPGDRGSSRGRTSGSSGSRKSVRLITPAEQDGRTQSKA